MNPLPSSTSRQMSRLLAAASADRSPPPETGQPAWPCSRSELATLVEDYADLLVWHAFRLLGSMPDAEDVVQDVFVRVFAPAGAKRSPRSGLTCIARSATPAPTSCARGRARPASEPVDLDRLADRRRRPARGRAGRRGMRPDRGPARAIAARAGRSDPAARLRRAAAGRDRRGPRLPDQHRQLPPALRLPEAARGGRTERSGPMNCHECRQWIDDLLLRDPDEAPPADIARHLAECDECAPASMRSPWRRSRRSRPVPSPSRRRGSRTASWPRSRP